MTTARILDSGREPPIAGLVPEPRLVSCPKGDSGGCIIVTIELPDSRSYSSETAPRSLSLCICVGLSVRAARENLGFGGAPPESILGCYSDVSDGGSQHEREGVLWVDFPIHKRPCLLRLTRSLEVLALF